MKGSFDWSSAKVMLQDPYHASVEVDWSGDVTDCIDQLMGTAHPYFNSLKVVRVVCIKTIGNSLTATIVFGRVPRLPLDDLIDLVKECLE